jgi:gliding motility-associated-like protein
LQLTKQFFRILLQISATVLTTVVYAQNPEQDCVNAIQVCTTSFSQNISSVGFGTVQELSYPYTTGCLAAGEQNSTWYTFTVTSSGSLEFTLSPAAFTDDYDWAIFNITGTGCPGIMNGTAQEVACNYSVFPGVTGMNPTGALLNSGPLDPNTGSSINLIAGNTYAMVINNATGSVGGYQLDFSGTANLLDNKVPTPDSIIHRSCDQQDTLFIHMSESVLCSSIAADGSDFIFSGPSGGSVYSAFGVGCGAVTSTHLIGIVLNNPIVYNGLYTLTIKTGNDGTTLTDICGNATPVNYKISYQVTNIPIVDLGNDTAMCDGEVMVFDATNNNATYYWSNGMQSPTISINDYPVLLWVYVDRNGCYARDSINIESACSIFIPNAFSPNGDGVNDVFGAISAQLNTYEISIYDRWGVRVFYSYNLKDVWDGTDGWGVPYPLGVYVYVVTGTFRNGEKFKKFGNVSLLR